ncbi:MAG: hypothetical protein KGI70_00195 [Patescibacteria group bacterium]|nr:hypothetical protein [Patescibacteria group bacterium]
MSTTSLRGHTVPQGKAYGIHGIEPDSVLQAGIRSEEDYQELVMRRNQMSFDFEPKTEQVPMAA